MKQPKTVTDGASVADLAQDSLRRAAVRADVKAFLMARGDARAHTSELTKRYGGHAIVRLNEIRHEDPVWDYSKQREGTGYRYRLVRISPTQGATVTEPEVDGPAHAGRLF